jgi:DNA-binding MarR family transcriptional regulator
MRGVGGMTGTLARRTADDPYWQIRRLMIETLTHVNEELTAFAKTFDLTLAQAVALCELGAPVTMRELSDQMCVRATNMTTIIDKLEAQGLVQRGSDPLDRRITRLELTASGARTRAALLDGLPTPVILARLPTSQRDQLLGLLQSTADGMHDDGAGLSTR